MSVDVERLLDIGTHPVGKGHGVREVDVFGDDDELVAADARGGVAHTQHRGHPVGDGQQDAITGLMSQAVVDDFEAVKVAEQDRDRLVRPCRPGQRVIEPVEQQDPVGQPGQLIMRRLVDELVLDSLGVGDVLHLGNDEGWGGALIAGKRAGHQQPADLTVGPDVPLLDHGPRVLAADEPREPLPVSSRLVRMGHVPDRHGRKGRSLSAEDLAQRTVDFAEPPVQIQDCGADRGRPQCEPQSLEGRRSTPAAR